MRVNLKFHQTQGEEIVTGYFYAKSKDENAESLEMQKIFSEINARIKYCSPLAERIKVENPPLYEEIEDLFWSAGQVFSFEKKSPVDSLRIIKQAIHEKLDAAARERTIL